MKLHIESTYNSGFDEDTYHLSTSMLKSQATHLFIASNLWESIQVDLDETIPDGYLSNLNMVCSDIRVKLPKDITESTLRALIDLYPDKRGKLRMTYLSGKSLEGVLGECLVQS